MDYAPGELQVTGTFPRPGGAEAAAGALAEAGLPRSSIELTIVTSGSEALFVWRLVLVIVLWSIVGGVAGALVGLALAATIGPEGTAGLIFQVVCWMIIGHLVVGMIAGYVVLADRTQRELSPGRVVTMVAVRCPEGDAGRIEGLLRTEGGVQVEVRRVEPLSPRR